jgi:DNA invertase Pin-like site-specific DNA recombinase
MFTIIAAIAELERNIIKERVDAGLECAHANGTRSGKPVGRPRVIFRHDQVFELRNQDMPWRQIAKICGVGVTTVRRAYQSMKAKRGLPRTG